MAIVVRIENEVGVPEGETWWHSWSTAFLAGEHPGTCCLRFVDAYGDAVFNQRQLPVLLDELQALRRSVANPEFEAALDDLLAFLQPALNQVHTYVRFLGD